LASLPPNFVFTAIGAAVGHHGVGRLRWRSGPPNGPAAVTGTDVARFRRRPNPDPSRLSRPTRRLSRASAHQKGVPMPKTGLEALLRPERDSILVLIDHQPYQFANLHSHEQMMIVNNVIGLAKTAKVFNVPTILTTVIEERGGYLIKGLQDVFPEQKPIDRTFINTWQDERVVEIVKKSRSQSDRSEGGLSRWTMEGCLGYRPV
jgi:hypothetical protein